MKVKLLSPGDFLLRNAYGGRCDAENSFMMLARTESSIIWLVTNKVKQTKIISEKNPNFECDVDDVWTILKNVEN